MHPEAHEGFGHGAVHDLQHAAAGQEFVFDQRDVGLDAGSVAIHEERDRASRGEHGDLCIAITVLATRGEGAVPATARLDFEVIEIFAGLDVFDRAAMQANDA